MGYPNYEAHLDALAQAIHENAKAKGFWDDERNFGEMLALIHSEVSEALEEHRKGRPVLYYANDDGTGKPEGALPELADVLIRTLDTMYHLTQDTGITIEGVVLEKMRYNASREYKHGKAY